MAHIPRFFFNFHFNFIASVDSDFLNLTYASLYSLQLNNKNIQNIKKILLKVSLSAKTVCKHQTSTGLWTVYRGLISSPGRTGCSLAVQWAIKRFSPWLCGCRHLTADLGVELHSLTVQLSSNRQPSWIFTPVWLCRQAGDLSKLFMVLKSWVLV